jgi:hypothetical protein
MRVNGFLSQVSGTTKIKLYEKIGDNVCEYVQSMPVNEYFNEEYDKSFVDYDLNVVSVQDNMLCIWIRPTDKSQLANAMDYIREQLDSLRESLDDFEEKYL